MTIRRRLVLDNLQDQLQAITTANGYNTEVSNVFRHTRTWNEVDSTIRPAICIHPGQTVYEYRPGDCVRAQFTVDLLCYLGFSAADEDTKINEINDLLDDIWVAIFTDTTLGGNAIETKILQAWTDEADADGQESLRVTLSIWYERTTSRST